MNQCTMFLGKPQGSKGHSKHKRKYWTEMLTISLGCSLFSHEHIRVVNA